MNKNDIELRVYTDGGARGNPGPAAVGVHIEDEEGNHVASIGKKIGDATNNVAEYKAVIEAFDLILELNKNISKLSFFMDSNLVASQLSGTFKIKNANLRNLLFEIRKKEAILKIPATYSHIPREQNKKADLLVNQALDNLI